jgi:hypothetical protein
VETRVYLPASPQQLSQYLSDPVQEWGSPHIMASEGNLAGVERLLEEGTPVDSRDSEGCSALHWACDRGSLEVSLCHNWQTLPSRRPAQNEMETEN